VPLTTPHIPQHYPDRPVAAESLTRPTKFADFIMMVLTARNVRPEKTRIDLKAWATRCLKEQFDASREEWWAERGSIRFLFDEESLDAKRFNMWWTDKIAASEA